MTNAPPSFVKPHQPSDNAILKVRPLMHAARALQMTKEALEEQLADVSAQLNNHLTKLLPDAMQEAGIRKTTLEQEGNYPAVEIELKNFYGANIKADWPEPQRAEAFRWLQDNGHGDLIKTDVIVPFARDKRDEAIKLVETLIEQGLNVTAKENVNHMTLTAWLKESCENGEIPPLDVIGGIVGKVAKLKVKE